MLIAANAAAKPEYQYLQAMGDTRYHVVESSFTQQRYHLFVRLPDGYEESNVSTGIEERSTGSGKLPGAGPGASCRYPRQAAGAMLLFSRNRFIGSNARLIWLSRSYAGP